MTILRIGSSGPEVTALQRALSQAGFSPGACGGNFGPGTQSAVLAFQRSRGLAPDGIAGPGTASALGLDSVTLAIPAVTVELVAKMFPVTSVQNIAKHLPPVLDALVESELANKAMVLMALATIRAETEGFEPVAEGQSRFNTSTGGRPFDLYDNRSDLGNQGPPDGASFRGRGFIQLTGRSNYQVHGQAIGLGDRLIANPDLACDPEIAAKLLASFLKSREDRIKAALANADLATARRLVNGGSNGLDRFTAAFNTGQALIPDHLSA
jgi:peptidoglycan L-alanyl-D-glutamate endopeptidase CwlK